MPKKHKLMVQESKGQVKLNYRCQSAEFSIDDAQQAITDLAIAIDNAKKYKPVFSDRVEELYRMMTKKTFEGMKVTRKSLTPKIAWITICNDLENLELLRDRINTILEEFEAMKKNPAMKKKSPMKKATFRMLEEESLDEITDEIDEEDF